MGLLEKALQYKRDMNSKGKETLIDTITGPAETAFLDPESPVKTPPEKTVYREDVPTGGDESLSGNDIDDLLGPENDDILFSDDEPGARGDLSEQDLDLFELPVDDGLSPHEALESQKQRVDVRPDPFQFAEPARPVSESRQVSAHSALADGDDFFGPDDEPVIPKGAPLPAASSRSIDTEETDRPVPVDQEIPVELPRDIKPSMDTLRAQSVDAGRKELSAARGAAAKKPEKRFQDFLILYEIGKEIFRSENREELHDVILFSIMGQIGASSSSVLVPDRARPGKWSVAVSRGVTVKDEGFYLDATDHIFSDFLKNRAILDIEDYKDNQLCRDEYYKFISIDARLLAPILHNGTIIAALALGDKITIGDYSEEEKDFIESIGEISGIAMDKVEQIHELWDSGVIATAGLEVVQAVDLLQSRIMRSENLKAVEELLRPDLLEAGVTSFAVYYRDEREDAFLPLFVDKDDSLSLRRTDHRLAIDSPFVRSIGAADQNIRLADFRNHEALRSAFDEYQIDKMTGVWIFPVAIRSSLIGFLVVFQVWEEAVQKAVEHRLARLTRMLFGCIGEIRRMDPRENVYIDTIDPAIKRIAQEFTNADNLRISVTLVLFSIKNFKRYYNLYGITEARKVLDAFKYTIKQRLGERDFSVRFDRNKILLVLPGKTKKYAVPLANTIKNEILKGFDKKEMQLLITLLTTEYPADGKDIYGLLDGIE